MVERAMFEFTKRAKDILGTVSATRRAKVMDFLNISEQSALKRMAANLTDVCIIFAGGFESADRRRAIIFSSCISAEPSDAKVSVFRIEVIGSAEITHSQVLGSLMGLNIDRSVIGDIVVDTDGAFFASCSEFDEFLKDNFTKVGRHSISLELVEEQITYEQKFEEMEIIVSSMRLDVVVCALINVSRGKAFACLEAGFVQLNHVVCKKASQFCQVGDILSIRKHGKYKIIENKKKTKRGKFVLVVNKNI